MRNLITSALLLLAAASCKKDNLLDCFKSSGAEKTETRYLDAFNAIEVSDKMDITLIPGNTFKVEITAGAHLLKNITSTIQNNTLSLKNNNTCNFVRGYKRKITATVTLPVIKSITNNGVGDIFLHPGFSQDSIAVTAENSGDLYVNGAFKYISTNSNGNGDIYLSGSCVDLKAYLNGTNFLHAEALIVTDRIAVETVSVGDCFLLAGSASTFEIKIWRNGNVYYKGMPASITTQYEENCKGRLIQQN